MCSLNCTYTWNIYPSYGKGQSGFASHWLSFAVPKVTHLVWEFSSTEESFGRQALRILGILNSHHWFICPFNGFPLVVFLLRDYYTYVLLHWLSASFFSVFSTPQALLMYKEDPPECYEDIILFIL